MQAAIKEERVEKVMKLLYLGMMLFRQRNSKSHAVCGRGMQCKNAFKDIATDTETLKTDTSERSEVLNISSKYCEEA